MRNFFATVNGFKSLTHVEKCLCNFGIYEISGKTGVRFEMCDMIPQNTH